MPLSKYDRLMGGKGSTMKTLTAMRKTYGDRAKNVLYATINKRKKEASRK